MTAILSVSTAATEYGLTRQQIMHGIETGAIKAWPVSQPGAARTHWRMTATDVAAYRDLLRNTIP